MLRIAIIALLAVPAFASIKTGDRPSFKTMPFQATGDVITIALPPRTAGHHDLVAVQIVPDGAACTFNAGAVTSMESSPENGKLLDQLESKMHRFGPQDESLSDSRIEIRNAAEYATYILLELPQNKTLVIEEGGAEVYRSRVRPRSMFLDGVPIHTSYVHPAQALLMLSSPFSVAAALAPDIQEKDGRVIATENGLRNHLLSMPQVSLNAALAAGMQEQPAAFSYKIEIDSNGVVTSATPQVTGEQNLFENEQVQALKAARFQPFVLNGSPVAVTGQVVFFIFNSKTMKSSLD